MKTFKGHFKSFPQESRATVEDLEILLKPCVMSSLVLPRSQKLPDRLIDLFLIL